MAGTQTGQDDKNWMGQDGSENVMDHLHVPTRNAQHFKYIAHQTDSFKLIGYVKYVDMLL